MTMFSHFQQNLFEDVSTLSPLDSPASHSALQDQEKAETMSDISFRQYLRLLEISSRYGAYLKTFAAYFQSNLDQYSPKLPHRWKGAATRSLRLLCQLQQLTPRTGGIGFGSLLDEPEPDVDTLPTPCSAARDATPEQTEQRRKYYGGKMRAMYLQDRFNMLRTPDANMDRGDRSMDNMKSRIERGMPLNLNDQLTAMDKGSLPTPVSSSGSRGPDYNKLNRSATGISLELAVATLPTPEARDHKGANSKKHRSKDRGHNDQLPNAIANQSDNGMSHGSTLRLEPAFVEWMMGYPTDWTSLEAATTEPND